MKIGLYLHPIYIYIYIYRMFHVESLKIIRASCPFVSGGLPIYLSLFLKRSFALFFFSLEKIGVVKITLGIPANCEIISYMLPYNTATGLSLEIER
ncbi:MAG: hypothetical protein EOP34_08730 [Rickettsiales bacterium]|nr:MAG: hypothetical protein EOP34_08730 [Rickettsiales bacterium]